MVSMALPSSYPPFPLRFPVDMSVGWVISYVILSKSICYISWLSFCEKYNPLLTFTEILSTEVNFV